MRTMANTSDWTQRGFPKSHYYVRAWGSDRHPDLNYETTELPTHLHRRYPFVDVQRLDAIPRSALNGPA